MYDRINRTILGIAVVVAFTCALVPGALAEREEHGCSLRTLKGTWGFELNGTFDASALVASLSGNVCEMKSPHML